MNDFQVPGELFQALGDYFSTNLRTLPDIYRWPGPKNWYRGFRPEGDRPYEINVCLKRFLVREWANSSFDEKVSIAKWVVQDWGGIRGGKPERFAKYVREIETEVFEYKYNGIASYSKILPCVSIEQFAIYDQRVAVSLNAIQIINSVANGVAFPMPPGRNNKVGNARKGEGFAAQERFKPRALIKNRNFQRIKRDETYAAYLTTLMTLHSKLERDIGIYDLEMLLFADAERLAEQAMEIA